MDDNIALRQDLAAISQQQMEILAAIRAMQQTPDNTVQVLRADLNAVTAKIRSDLAEQKKSCLISRNLLPSSQLELIGWKRGLTGEIQRYYREIGKRP